MDQQVNPRIKPRKGANYTDDEKEKVLFHKPTKKRASKKQKTLGAPRTKAAHKYMLFQNAFVKAIRQAVPGQYRQSDLFLPATALWRKLPLDAQSYWEKEAQDAKQVFNEMRSMNPQFVNPAHRRSIAAKEPIKPRSASRARSNSTNTSTSMFPPSPVLSMGCASHCFTTSSAMSSRLPTPLMTPVIPFPVIEPLRRGADSPLAYNIRTLDKLTEQVCFLPLFS
jgi:hypothetical protein